MPVTRRIRVYDEQHHATLMIDDPSGARYPAPAPPTSDEITRAF